MPPFRKILENFKNIVGFELKKFLNDIKIELTGIRVTKTSNDKTNFEVSGNTLLVNPTFVFNLPINKKKKIKSDIIDVEIDEDSGVFTKESINRTSDIQKNLPTHEDKELLNFYRGKIAKEYLDALEGSLVIRNMSKKGIDISIEKSSISKKYPSFGRNLCNLVSENYFDNHFKDLYESMNQENDFLMDNYREQVEKIITGLPYISFVNSVESVETKFDEIKSKIIRLKKYGTGKLMIHGLSNENVKKTEEILELIDDDDELTYVIIDEIDKKSYRITVILIF